MNYFFALKPDADTSERLDTIVRRLQAWELPARWTQAVDYHVTVSFLGALDDHEAMAAAWSTQDVLAACVAQPLQLAGLGARGGSSQPRTVYAAFDNGYSWLNDFRADLHLALDDRQDERRSSSAVAADWRPHLTLCRPTPGTSPTGRTWPQLFEAFGCAAWGACVIEEVGLYRTRSQRERAQGGPRYEKLA